MKKMIILVIVLLVLGAVLFGFNSFISNKETKDNRTTYSAEDTKDNKAEYSAKEDLPKQIKNTVWASDYAMDWKLNVKKDLLEEVVAITINGNIQSLFIMACCRISENVEQDEMIGS